MSEKLEQAEATMIENLEAKTGRLLPQWIDLVKQSGLAKHGEIVAWLKSQHGLGHGYANLVVHKAKAAATPPGPAAAGDDPAAEQYAGEKAALRPLYDALIAAVRAFGPDVELAPKKAYVSLRRGKQFALIQPTTRTRIDLGINLKGVAPQGRLEASGSFSTMVTHRVRVERREEVDAQLIGWLRRAYDAA
jgi:hypothetical protein